LPSRDLLGPFPSFVTPVHSQLPRSSVGLREERAELESFHSRQRVVRDQRSVEMLLIHINTKAPARELS